MSLTFEPYGFSEKPRGEAPNGALDAARHDGLRRIGGMATMPTRAHTIQKVLPGILPQVDRLYLYLDKHTEVPETLARHPKIVPLLPSAGCDLAGCGKFLGIELFGEPCLYFGFDDDIVYPPDHVDVLTRALERQGMRALVGFHASLLKPPFESYRRNRNVLHFSAAVPNDRYVDVLGSGTSAFHTGVFSFHFRRWEFRDMIDLMLAIEAAKQGLPRITIQRPKDYLVALEVIQNDSVFSALAKDDSRQTRIMRAALKSLPLSWHLGPIPALD